MSTILRTFPPRRYIIYWIRYIVFKKERKEIFTYKKIIHASLLNTGLVPSHYGSRYLMRPSATFLPPNPVCV
jgi:hypothetical protein